MKISRIWKTPAIMLAVLLVNSGCNGDTTSQDNQTPGASISCVIDDTVRPPMESLPGFEGGPARPLAAVEDDDGVVTSFVANELLISVESQEDIDAILDLYGGEVVMELDPAGAGAGELSRAVLVRIQQPPADLDALAADMQAAAEADNMFGEASFRFSSEKAAGLFAAAYAQLAAGRSVAVGFLSTPTSIPGSTEEAPLAGGGYEDAYKWSYWQRGGALDIGVPESWSLLSQTGKLDNLVKIAIIDGGFAPDDDFRPYVAAAVGGGSAINRTSPMNCTGGAPCPWHGTGVASAAMAIADNQYGSAGTAGPVGSPVLVFTHSDLITENIAVIMAANRNAKIINMSFGGDLHWALKPVTAFFRATTDAVRDSGVLIFAAAGNDGRNVDAQTCIEFFGTHCWEKRFFYPCENPGVYCVGGLNESGTRDASSNYGNDSVDLWAPFCVNIGPKPSDNGANLIHYGTCGTSYSSPFTAGVAALVWAARPSLSSGQVMNLLLENTRGNSNIRIIHAYDAVVQAMGTGFDARIARPADGATLTSGVPVTLVADLNVVATPSSTPVPVTVDWYSSQDGPLGTTETSVPRTSEDGYNTVQSALAVPLSEGIHVITMIAHATISSWNSDFPDIEQDMITVTVENPAPQGDIFQPSDGSSFCQGQGITFRGEATDMNESLPDEAFSWLATAGIPPYIIMRDLGQGRVVSVADLGVGDWHITLRVTDSDGAEGSDAIDIAVLSSTDPACSNLPPTARIDAPSHGQQFEIDGNDSHGNYKEIQFQATATDPEDDDATLRVEWFSATDGKLGEGRLLSARVHMTDDCRQTIQITLRVTDSDGNVTEDTVEITLYVTC